MYVSWIRAVRGLALALCAALAGCATLPTADLHLPRYRPDVDGVLVAWDPAPAPAPAPPPAAAPAPAGLDPATPAAPAPAGDGIRVLRKGDKVVIYRRGIPKEDEIKDVVDDRGEVNLPLIRNIRIEGKTTSDAETMIEKAYIAGGFFRDINVIVVAQENEYYIQGEVVRPGRYMVSVGMTLQRAIISAGGYTDFANPRKVSITRGGRTTIYDMSKVADGAETDPPIQSDDVIVVGRKWVL